MRPASMLSLVAAAAAVLTLTAGCLTMPQDALDKPSDALLTNAGNATVATPADNTGAQADSEAMVSNPTRTVSSSSTPPAATTDNNTTASDAASDADTTDIPATREVANDINGDGVVNADDIVPLMQEYGIVGDAEGDLNGDGMVNVVDLGILLAMIDG